MLTQKKDLCRRCSSSVCLHARVLGVRYGPVELDKRNVAALARELALCGLRMPLREYTSSICTFLLVKQVNC